MPKGLPIAYIKKWGISKLSWQKFREGALTKGVQTRIAAIKRRVKGKKSMSPDPKRRTRAKGKRRGGRGLGVKGILVGIVGVAALKYVVRRFLPVVPQKYEDSISLIGVGAVGKVAKIGTANLLKPGIILGGANLVADLLAGGIGGFAGAATSNKGYDV